MPAQVTTLTLRLETYAVEAKQAVAAAQALADDREHVEVEPLHLLYRLVERAGLAQDAVTRTGVDPANVLVEAEARFSRLPHVEDAVAYLSPRMLDLLGRAEDEAARTKGRAVDTTHLLLACGREASGPAADVLRACGLGATVLRAAIEAARTAAPRASLETPSSRRAAAGDGPLDAFGVDVTRLAAQDRFDPTIGRDAELMRVIHVLARCKGNCPLLVGEPGIGKTSIVHGLAMRIVRSDVPALLAGKRIVSIEMSGLVAGAKLRGELEERVRSLLDAVRDSAGEVILFVPDLAALLGEHVPSSTGDMLGAALGRGELRAIAVATPDGLRRAMDKGTSLVRRFVPISVEPPTIDQTVAILRGIVDRLEAGHGVRISDSALLVAATFAKRYVPAMHLPKSAIDLVDEAAARVRVEMQSAAAESAVLPEHVALVVAAWTGIPMAKMMEGEAQKLLRMESRLAERVVGQESAVAAVSKAVRRGRVGLREPRKPIGSFLFLGPSGVGKTELAKALAEFLFDDEAALTRIDMSEFMEKHMVARLLGAPPGYADSEDGGYLTEAVRRRPYSVVLFDEIEKAHPDVFNILLQVLDDGRLTDSRGRTACFTDAVIVMTSNLGSEAILGHEGSPEALRATIRERLSERFRPELLNRIDDVVVFDALTREDLRGIVDIQLGHLSRLLGERGLALQVSSAARDRLVDMGYEPAYGARPLKRVIVKQLHDPLAEEILRGGYEAGDAVNVTATETGLLFARSRQQPTAGA